MSQPVSPAVRRAAILQRAAAVSLACAVVFAVVVTVLGGRVSWPLWLLFAGIGVQIASNFVRRSRPRASEALVLAGAILSLAADAALIVLRP